ncbi:hypothetical protein ACQP2T_07175 [Nonomuraea sp. CA-143628]|uniref:hypothetical protein n=1 Tax=Nonomuraea sp. CA-143628 TaxID=3239997 RepID=UPI003D8C7A37
MTIPDGTTESSILALDDGDVYVCQDGTHVPPHSSSPIDLFESSIHLRQVGEIDARRRFTDSG